jgi:hypothetical protein
MRGAENADAVGSMTVDMIAGTPMEAAYLAKSPHPDLEHLQVLLDKLGATYEGAWLACVLLADAGGEAALVSFYRDVSDCRPLAAALRDRFGLTEAALTRLWQQRLAGLADRQGG